MDHQVIESVYEFFFNEGFTAGHEDRMTEDQVIDYVQSWPLPKLTCRPETEENFIVGFLMGVGAREYEAEEALEEAIQKAKKIEASGRSVIGSRITIG